MTHPMANEPNLVKTFRFNIYYTVGQEVAVKASSPEEALAMVRDGCFEEVGDTWDVRNVDDMDVEPVDELEGE